MPSVGKAWAVLKGRLTADPEESSKFLEGLSQGEHVIRNRKENRVRNKLRKTKRLLGSRGN